MQRRTIVVAFIIGLMGLTLPVQARDGSDQIAERVTRETSRDSELRETQTSTSSDDRAPSTSSATESQTTFVLSLTGDAEVPSGSGDPDGWGMAGLRLRADEAGLCYSIRVSDLDPVVAVHVHSGGVGVDGSVFVDLAIAEAQSASRDGITAFWQCLNDLDAAALAAIEANPAGYYLNVHTTAFPDGAVRGQLVSEGMRAQ